MAEIEYRPWKRIVIHEVHELTPKDFFEGLVSAAEAQKLGAAPVVQWADGIAFVFQPMPDTENVLNDKVNGILHYNIVQFARTSYYPEKKVTWQGRDHTVRMNKNEKNADFINLAKFLSDRPPLEPS